MNRSVRVPERTMALIVAAALMLIQMSAFATSNHYCRNYTYTPVGWSHCGGKPTISNIPATLRWISNNGSFGGSVDSVELDLRKVDNAWNQTGCFNLGEALSGSGSVPTSYSYPIPSDSVDYDSLYIARLLWVDSAGNSYHIKDGDCYFTLQPTPSAPLNVAAVAVTSSSITWIWDKPTNHGNKVTHYQVNNYLDIVNVTTGTYYNWTGLSPNRQYSIRVRAVTGSGKYGSWSPWDHVYTLPGPPASPLAVVTGILGTMVVLGIVAAPLFIGITWWVSKVKGKKLNRSRSDYNCELRENVAYFTTSSNKQWSQSLFDMEEEEEECEEEDKFAGGKALEQLEPMSPQVPSRKYLLDKKKGPTVFASIPVFVEMGFKEKSGWYQPNVADVIAEKLGVDVAAFPELGSGVYFMCHRTKEQAKWVGLSPDLCRTLCGLFFQLYQKECSALSPLEVELKFFSPLAADWDIKVWTADPKDLVLERAKKIVEYKTLKPLGLNNALKLTTREMWEEFINWFAAQRGQQS